MPPQEAEYSEFLYNNTHRIEGPNCLNYFSPPRIVKVNLLTVEHYKLSKQKKVQKGDNFPIGWPYKIFFLGKHFG